MTHAPKDREGDWPTHCEECGTELQSAQVEFQEADFSDGKQGTPVTTDFCPNPDCPHHDADLAAKADPEAGVRERPGSLGGDNGGG